MTYAELVELFGQPVRDETTDMGLARPIRTLSFRCKCVAENVAAPDKWTTHREACTAKPPHYA